jgi:hypothetical protein
VRLGGFEMRERENEGGRRRQREEGKQRRGREREK